MNIETLYCMCRAVLFPTSLSLFKSLFLYVDVMILLSYGVRLLGIINFKSILVG